MPCALTNRTLTQSVKLTECRDCSMESVFRGTMSRCLCVFKHTRAKRFASAQCICTGVILRTLSVTHTPHTTHSTHNTHNAQRNTHIHTQS